MVISSAGTTFLDTVARDWIEAHNIMPLAIEVQTVALFKLAIGAWPKTQTRGAM